MRMSEEYLTIKEIARRLEVPESNIRYYRDRFHEFLPAVGQGRKKRYKPQALEVFRYIVQAYQNDLSTDQIVYKLQQEFPRHLLPAQNLQDTEQEEAYQQQISFHGLLHSQASTLERLSQALLQKDSLDSEVNRLGQEQQRLKKGLVLLWKNSRQALSRQKQPDPENEQALQRMEQEIQELRQKQEELQGWVESELQEIKNELKKSQFWTKRLLLKHKQDTNSSDQEQG